MLEMRAVCERCGAGLEAAGSAFICSFECTFCPSCTGAMGKCPNCGGELLPRPRRLPKGLAPAISSSPPPLNLSAREATPADAAAISSIYNQGIEDGTSTFESRPRTAEEVGRWMGGRHPVVVVESDLAVVGFAAASEHSARACYGDIAEFSVYVERARRRLGIGQLALTALFDKARAAGFRKLVSRVFTSNAGSRALLARVGFREVGFYEKHGRLGDVWHDVVIVEKLL